MQKAGIEVFESFLVQFALVQGSSQLRMSASMARDPLVKKFCNIQSGHGSFLGKSIMVVPDLTGENFK